MTTTAPVGDAVIRVSRALQALTRVASQHRVYETLTAEAGVSLDRAGEAVLREIVSADGPVQLRQLAERLGVEASGITRQVQRLEADGYVARGEDPDDRRACRVHATASGQRAVTRLQSTRERRLVEALTGWTSHDRDELGRLLSKLADEFVSRHGGRGGGSR